MSLETANAQGPAGYGAPIVNHLSDFSQTALAELKAYFEQVGLAIPVNQLTGFSQFVAQTSVVVADQTTASASFTDLSTVGPQLTNLPAGKYVFLFGALCGTSAAAAIDHVGISFSGAAVAANESFDVSTSTDIEWGCFPVLHTFTDANAVNNTACLKYSTSTGTADFRERWLLGIKYA